MLRIGRSRSLALAAGCGALVMSASRPAGAQTQPSEGVYVSGSALGDVKRFSGDPTTNALDGQSFGGAVTLGTSIATRWDLEIGVDVPAFTSTLQPRPVTLRRSTIALQSRTRNRTVSVATLVRFRSAPRGRVQLGYLAGLSFVRLHRKFDTLAPAGIPASLIPKPHKSVDYGAAPTAGVDAQIAIVAHLSVVPGIHASVFNLEGVSGVLLRPRIGVRWTF